MRGTSDPSRPAPAELLFGLAGEEAAVSIRDRVCQAYVDERRVVFAYLRSLGAPSADAEELTQEAFVAFYVALRRGKQIDVQRAWLFTVASRLFLNWQRSHRGAIPVPFEEEMPALARSQYPGATPEAGLLEAEKLRRVAEAIRGLSTQQQICLHLRAEGLTYRVIAETLGIGLPTVAEFVRRALNQLRRTLNG
jgi:RNA polymerase sigma-70 factor (ECF subfamily)